MLARKITFDSWFILRGVRRYSACLKNAEGFVYEPKFSSVEQEKILTVINESNTDQLSRFDISRQRIKSLDSYKDKKGPFKTLSEILEVEGLGVKVLDKLCQSIVANNYAAVLSSAENITPTAVPKIKRNLLSPTLPVEIFQTLKTAVGIHVHPTGVSWARYNCTDRKIEEWDFYCFDNLPNKMLPTETFELVLKILNKIPVGHAYIFEASQNISPQQNNTSITVSFNHQQELLSMLLTTLNTSPVHNTSHKIANERISCSNKVFFLRAKVPARLFKTLVGGEKVSAINIINTLIEDPEEFDLSCSRVKFEPTLKDVYLNISANNKELLGQSLMLVLSFIDLCILKNPVSLRTIAPGNRRN